MDRLNLNSKESFRKAAIKTGFLLIILFAVFVLEKLLDLNLYWLGVKPLHWNGLLGILTSPLKHHDFGHLINNSLLISILALGYFLHFSMSKPFRKLFVMSVICNFWLWINARDAWHYGASGVVYALFFFLITVSFKHKRLDLLVFILSCLMIYAGFFIGLFPYDVQVSHEAHIYGSLAGILVGLFEKKLVKKREVDDNVSFSANSDFKYVYKSRNS